VRGWLGSRGFDLALTPGWNDSAGQHRSTSFWYGEGRGWWWSYLYDQSFPAVGCLARRVASCREAVLAGASDDNTRTTSPPVLMTDRRFWQRQRLLGGTSYLSDVVREVGRDRFLEFWNSSLSVDSALSRALRRPVGEWTADWQGRFGPTIRLGAGAPAAASLLALLLAGAAVASIALTARKRQVR
jgi:hypothetical protein